MLAFVLIALFTGVALASAMVLADSGLRGVSALRRLRAELRSLDLAANAQPRRQVMIIRAAGQRRMRQEVLPALRAAA